MPREKALRTTRTTFREPHHSKYNPAADARTMPSIEAIVAISKLSVAAVDIWVIPLIISDTTAFATLDTPLSPNVATTSFHIFYLYKAFGH